MGRTPITRSLTVTMAHTQEWIDYFTMRLAEAEARLAGFDDAVAKYGRVLERDATSEWDVTDRERQTLQDAVEACRRCLCDEHLQQQKSART